MQYEKAKTQTKQERLTVNGVKAANAAETGMYLNTIISPEGAAVAISPANGKYYTLQEMQAMVGGYIDIVTSASGEFCYVVHESGMYCKEFNGTATMHFFLRSGYYQETPLFGNIAIIERKYMR